MPFGPVTIDISLNKAVPSKMTVDSLSSQLDAVGLVCSDANEALLPGYIAQTRRDMAQGGGVQSFMVMRVKGDNNVTTATEARDYEETGAGNWAIDGSFGYHTELLYINYEDHFNWLTKNEPSFGGLRNDPPMYQGTESTVDAIQKQFVNCSYTASSVVVDGLNQEDMEASMWNAIKPLTDENAKNYDEEDSRSLFLVYNYDVIAEEADGIGILTLKWHLKVWDYKEKSKDELQHKWELTISAWSVLYNDGADIEANYNSALAHFG